MKFRLLSASRALVLRAAVRARGAAMSLWLAIPIGNICTLRNGNQTITLTKNYWVIVSDGRSSDAMPVTMVSQGLVEEFAKKMRAMGYAVPAEEATVAA